MCNFTFGVEAGCFEKVVDLNLRLFTPGAVWQVGTWSALTSSGNQRAEPYLCAANVHECVSLQNKQICAIASAGVLIVVHEKQFTAPFS